MDSKRSKGLCTQEKKKKVKDYKTDNEVGFPNKVPWVHAQALIPSVFQGKTDSYTHISFTENRKCFPKF